ncbi:MAG: hypothetical protein F9K25_18720 [Candidatus Contendobacter sp.]|nr:MAG: hypothetical protein F9K25_18720 [Candidatus Contendobacter sp.]
MTLAVASRATYLRCEFKFGVWAGDTPPTQFYDPINFTKLEIASQTQEFEQLISNMESTYGQTLASVAKPTEVASLAAEADYMPPYLFGLLLGADITELSQSSGAVADEAITPAVGLWVPLANQYIAPHGTGTEIVAETSGDVVVASTHYTIDHINGLFKALDSTGATVAKISYHKAARTGEIYKGGQAKSAYLKLVGTGTEKVSQKRCRLLVHKVSLAASAAFDPVAGGYVKGSFAGDLLTPTGETSPWTYNYLDQAE